MCHFSKTKIILALTIFYSTSFGQKDDFKELLDSAKNLFKSERTLNQDEIDKFDYLQIVSLLEKVIILDSTNAEAKYFLGYTYSRINSRDGRSMIGMNVKYVLKASEQFEKLIKLNRKYTGEIIVLDPYSKLTAEWGSMAMSYWHNNKIDSAKWAFNEGKKRGGFSKFILELNKKVLDACSPKSILISSGDNFTIPLWYLQIVEGYRQDISVIDISLLNSVWYPTYLSQNKIVNFNLTARELENIEYMKWADSTVTINNFSWVIKPSYYDQYILRGDRLFLSLLKQNLFKRDIYFTDAFTEESRLSLKNYLTPLIVADKLTPIEKLNPNYESYKNSITKLLQLSERLNLDSPDEIMFYDNLRYNLLEKIDANITTNNKKRAKELMQILENYSNDSKIPYHNKSGKEYADYIKNKL